MEQNVCTGIEAGVTKIVNAVNAEELQKQLVTYLTVNNIAALVDKINAAAAILEMQGSEDGLAEAANYIPYNTALAMAIMQLRCVMSPRGAAIQLSDTQKRNCVSQFLARLEIKLLRKFPEEDPLEPDKPE
jgi:hypothetical protein